MDRFYLLSEGELMARAHGFTNARRKSRRRAKKLDDAVVAGISATVDDVHRTGIENMDLMVKKRSGRLRRGYRKRISAKTLRGLVGYLSASARRAAFYARFVHDGTAKARGRPYHDTAVLEHEGRHRSRMRDANSIALDDRASPSGTGRSGRARERSLT